MTNAKTTLVVNAVGAATGIGAEAWDRYVLGHQMASGYHVMAWRQVIEEAFGHHTFYLMATDEHGETQGVLPLVLLASRLFGRFLISMPFLNYGGLLTDTAEAQTALLGRAIDLAREHRTRYVELRHQERGNLDWPSKQHKVSMRLPLPKEFETLWKSFPAKLRSQIRRAQKEGMTVRIGQEELLQDFYQIFCRNMRDLGTPVHGQTFFKVILRAFPQDTCLCVIYHHDKPMAAGLLYSHQKTLEIPWASSDRRYNRLAPNMMLYNSVLEYACHQGFQVFDFGRSTQHSGTYRFKEQWGAIPTQLHWQYWLKEGNALLEQNPSNPKYRKATYVWQKLPIHLTKVVGPFLIKNLPLA